MTTAPADDPHAPADERITSALELLLVMLIVAALAAAAAAATWGITDVGADANCRPPADVFGDANTVAATAMCG